MLSAHEFLHSLAVVLCVAAVTTVLFQKLKQPVVLGYLIAGLIVGPHLPVPLVANPTIVHALSELGVILLMFSLGLEFRLKKLLEVGPTAGITAIVHCSFMLWAGFTVGRVMGWTTLESIFTGAVVAISSTTIVAKAFDERGVKGPLRSLVLGELIVEDLFAILLMATLTAVSTGSGLDPKELLVTTGRLAAFLVGLVVIGLLVVPRAMRAIVKMGKSETTLVASIGVCFATALLANNFGYSVALGAFVAGSLVAESGEAKTIEHLVQPVRDVFAAIFFVSVGMLIDPRLVIDNAGAVAVLVVVVVVGKVGSVTVGAFLTGAGVRTSVQAGMSLAQIGEFSFIIAALGLSLNATGSFLYPVAIAVSALTTLTTPWMIRFSEPAARLIDRKLPQRIQTFATLYGSWIEQLRRATPKQKKGGVIARMLRMLILDAVALGTLIIATSLFAAPLSRKLELILGVPEGISFVVTTLAASALGLTLFIGLVRASRRMGMALAERALPTDEQGRVDLANSPRRALLVTLQLATLLLVGFPLLAITQPFLPGWQGALLFVATVGILAVVFWRRATDLQGHVKAGTEVLIDALAKRALSHPSSTSMPAMTSLPEPASLPPSRFEMLRPLLAGLGEPATVILDESSAGAGKSLAELNVRGVTGASVLAVLRGDRGFAPGPDEKLRAGDVLALTGATESIEAATRLLTALEGEGHAEPLVPHATHEHEAPLQTIADVSKAAVERSAPDDR